MINDSRISKLLNRVKFVSPTDDKAVKKLFEAQEGGQKYNYVPKSRVGYRPNPDGTESTHLMAREYIPGRGWVVFPTLYQDSNNEWIDMGETHGVNWWPIYEYAQQVGELYDFGEDEEDAINFADKGIWKENMNKRPFFKTRLSPTDELRFQKFFKTLPENLQTDDDLYDIRGYWDAEGKPDQFDYSQPKEEDGYHHAYSRHPYTGKILKSPAHPTFQDAMENETHKRVDVYGNVYTGLPKMQDAGTVIDKDGFIDIEKSYGINPLSAEGIQLARDLASEYPNAKFVCTAQGCAQIASDAAEASGYDFSRSNAWDIGNRNTVDYINPVYQDEIGQGQPLSDPDWSREFPQEMFVPGNLVGLNRYNSESSYRYADQEEFPGSRGYEHIGYMLDDNTLLHGTGKTAEHPAYFILDDISDNRIKLPHYGSYEPVESISPAGYMKSIGNFAGDVANFLGFEKGGELPKAQFGASMIRGDLLYDDHMNKENDTTLENFIEIIDPTGILSHDDAKRAYEEWQKSGEDLPTFMQALDMFGAVPALGKLGKLKYVVSPGIELMKKAYGYIPWQQALNIFDGIQDLTEDSEKKEGGNISQMGYRDDSPYKDRDFIDIETEEGLIDMSNTGETLLATDLETGEQRILEPYSGLHKFVGTKIREEKLPKAQDGTQFNVEPAESTSVYTYPIPLEKSREEQVKDWTNKWLGSKMYKDIMSRSGVTPEEASELTSRKRQNIEDLDIVFEDNPGGEANVKGATRKGLTTFTPFGDTSTIYSGGSESTPYHEAYHGALRGSFFDEGLNITGSGLLTDAMKSKIAETGLKDTKYRQYVGSPQETAAFLQGARFDAERLDVMDPFNEKMTLDIIKTMKSENHPQLKALRKTYTDEQIVDLWNSVAQQESQPQQGFDEYTEQTMARMGGQQYQDGGISFSTLDSDTELVRQRTKRNGDVVSIVKRKGPGGEFSRYKIVTRNGEVINVSQIHGEGGFEDEDYVPYTPDEMYMQQNQFEIRPEPNSQNNRNINNFEINKKK